MKINDILGEELATTAKLTVAPATTEPGEMAAKDAAGNTIAKGNQDAMNALQAAVDKGATIENPAMASEELGNEPAQPGYHRDTIASGNQDVEMGNGADKFNQEIVGDFDRINHAVDEGPEPAFGTPEYWAKVQSGEIKVAPAPMPVDNRPTPPNPAEDAYYKRTQAEMDARSKANPYKPVPMPTRESKSADDILLDKMLNIAGIK